MSEKYVIHQQMPKAYEKTQAMSLLAAAMSGSGSASTGHSTWAFVNSWRSDFANVRQIIIKRKRNLVHVNGVLMHNQVFAEDEDFEFVLGCILERIPPSAAVKDDRRDAS